MKISNYFKLDKLSEPDKYNNRYMTGTYDFVKLNLILDIEFQVFNQPENDMSGFETLEKILKEFEREFSLKYLDSLKERVFEKLSLDLVTDNEESECNRRKKSLQLHSIIFFL
ncbi:protein of unknown function [Tenacibaculum sp. 190130A14a]|uniref:Uncharacterized protein n=1 Tax=Tenacibaculum polynesiense TaxID=3137857 RepID=A0ABP1EYY8_9FLAO